MSSALFVCTNCGVFHMEPDAECCGVELVPIEQALGSQDTLFELSGNDRALNVLHHLKADYAAASDRVTKTKAKLGEAALARDAAAETLMDFYKLTTAGATTSGERGLLERVADEVNGGALDTDGVTVRAETRS